MGPDYPYDATDAALADVADQLAELKKRHRALLTASVIYAMT